MREILFRGKAINRENCYHRTEYKNGEWVYGLVTKLYDEQFENLPAEMTDINGISNIEIDYKTIGQYTGMLDKNGIKIFEGDILKFFNDIFNDNSKTSYYDVAYFETDCRWIIRKKGRILTDLDDFVHKFMSVVGNVYDNPELLYF